MKLKIIDIVPFLAACVLMLVIISPTYANTENPRFMPEHEMIKVCERSIAELNPEYLVHIIEVRQHWAFDLILVFRVFVGDEERFVTVTVKGDCIIDFG